MPNFSPIILVYYMASKRNGDLAFHIRPTCINNMHIGLEFIIPNRLLYAMMAG